MQSPFKKVSDVLIAFFLQMVLLLFNRYMHQYIEHVSSSKNVLERMQHSFEVVLYFQTYAVL